MKIVFIRHGLQIFKSVFRNQTQLYTSQDSASFAIFTGYCRFVSLQAAIELVCNRPHGQEKFVPSLIGLPVRNREEHEMEKAAKITGPGPNSTANKPVDRTFNNNEAMAKVLCYEIEDLLPDKWRYFVTIFLLAYFHSAVLLY